MSNKPTIEELLAQVTQQEKTKKRRKIEDNTNAKRYIQEMGLEVGTQAVPNYVIFWHYNMIWKGSDNKYKANKIVFFRTFSKQFPSHRNGDQRFYLLKENCIEVNAQILEEAKLYDKKYVRFSSKKEKKSKEGTEQVSSDSSGDETP